MKIFAVIMAGGVGTRFWPYSREARPKQLLDVLHNGSSLLQQTLERTAQFADAADTLIVTSAAHREPLSEQDPPVILLPNRSAGTPPRVLPSRQRSLKNAQAKMR